jgi:signal transduction histidine kinase
MNVPRSELKEFRKSLALPEMRIFWFLAPPLLVVLVIGIIYLPPLVATANSGLLLAVVVAVGIILHRTARLNYDGRVERNELRSIVLSLDDALIAYDQSFNMLYFNPAAEKLFQLQRDEVFGREIHPQDAETPRFRRLTQVIFPSLAPVMVKRSEGEGYPQVLDLSFSDPAMELRVTTAPVADEEGNLFGFMKIIRDRTRELSLIKSKNEFITVASHQLRTPLTEIAWALETLSKDPGLNESAKAIVEPTLAASRELTKITEDLLNIAKIEEGHFGYSFEQMDIIAFVETLLAPLLPITKAAGLKLYFDKPKEPLPKVVVDQKKLSLALNNLLENAIRYNVKNGEVTVKVERLDGPWVKVSVKDTGIGIPAEALQKIFMKFFRAENALKFQTEGSGLGLYIAQNIVRSHGGQMWVESELNRGTTFSLTLTTDQRLVPARELPFEY